MELVEKAHLPTLSPDHDYKNKGLVSTVKIRLLFGMHLQSHIQFICSNSQIKVPIPLFRTLSNTMHRREPRDAMVAGIAVWGVARKAES